MVADFGIALAVSAAAGGRMTETGLSLGTPHYMSPEQATAEKDITGRSDVYSLASVLYEMLTGDPPHTGSSAQQIIMKIVTEEPAPVTKLRRSVPPNVAAAVAKALEKLPADRFESAKAFADALADPGFRTGAQGTVSGSQLTATAGRWRRASLGLAAVALACLVVTVWALTRHPGGVRDLGTPPSSPVHVNEFRAFSVSPDGSFLIYIAQKGATTELWYRSLETGDGHAIPGTDGAYTTPLISPDGKRLAVGVSVGSGYQLKVMDVDGRTSAAVASITLSFGGAWTDDGRIFLGDDNGRLLRWLDPLGGDKREVTVGGYCLNPVLVRKDRVLCGGRSEKFASSRDLSNPDRIRYWHHAAGRDGGEPTLLRGADFRVVGDRYLVYMGIDGAIMATRIESLDSLTVGRSVSLVPGVRSEDYTGTGQFDLTRDGTLVYLPGTNAAVGRLVRVADDGRIEPLPVEEAAHLRFRESPDGRRLATVVEGIRQQELRVYDLQAGTHQTVAEGSFIDVPVFGPRGDRLAYAISQEPGQESLVSRLLDSSKPPRVLAASAPPGTLRPSMYLSADSLLVGVPGRRSAMVVDSEGRVDSLGLSTGQFLSISPDHRWIAYQGSAAGDLTIQPWPSLDHRYVVAARGNEPQWRSATELVYTEQTDEGDWEFREVKMHPGADPPVGAPERIALAPQFSQTAGWSWAVGRDGDLLYLQSPAEREEHYFRVVPGWVKR
ncbi:MAG TPA: protein kinase, partial [Gemmatimonadota bacterium]|nr:protein kinase [Gemmatimonadota bacterium]